LPVALFGAFGALDGLDRRQRTNSIGHPPIGGSRFLCDLNRLRRSRRRVSLTIRIL